MPASPIRPGFPTASPYLIFRDAAPALEFYKQALGAVEISRHLQPNGRVGHAEMRIGDSTFLLASENPAFPFIRSLESFGDSPVQIFLYVDEVDARFQRALNAGATTVMPIADQPYGRSGGFKDPFGLVWWLSTHTPQPAR
jgi:PhnB protein